MAEEPLDAESQALEEVRLSSSLPFHITAMITSSNVLLCNALLVSSGVNCCPRFLPFISTMALTQDFQKQRLKSALWYRIGKIVDEETLKLGVNATPQFIGSLTELTWAQIGRPSNLLGSRLRWLYG